MGQGTLRLVVESQPHQVIPAWVVTTPNGIKYYQCGRCWMKERQSTPTGVPEARRPLPQGTDQLCVFCQRKAMPYVP